MNKILFAIALLLCANTANAGALDVLSAAQSAQEKIDAVNAQVDSTQEAVGSAVTVEAAKEKVDEVNAKIDDTQAAVNEKISNAKSAAAEKVISSAASTDSSDTSGKLSEVAEKVSSAKENATKAKQDLENLQNVFAK